MWCSGEGLENSGLSPYEVMLIKLVVHQTGGL
jgi:hypothetical protein